ncbi:Rhodanese-related sulfurtransferase [Zobellia uliginosa]|uniref:Rhodanese-related sulfurtransferase n=1 Tax=Zobellia uliginosa TaxID=143224 RepID=A0ABY1KVI3_9FLAO|nr:rhodanese-like domain-containing protein [Zobellia uliginosa]SIS83564.1 Rhodanese-related sulfurtransferase [Zobellia uliginosa]
MKVYIFTLLLCMITLGCAQSKTKPITDFSQNDIENAILLDVRTPEEFNGGHLDKAVNINWFDADFAERVDSIDRAQTVYVYCKKGGRSAKAAQVLDSLGFNVVDLEGGYDAYVASKKN